MDSDGCKGPPPGAPAGPRDGALDAVRRTMSYVGENAAHRAAFGRSPITVLRVAAAGLPPEDVERARRALEEVLGVATLDRSAQAQALLGIVASVLRASRDRGKANCEGDDPAGERRRLN